jgi:hypothetical protein
MRGRNEKREKREGRWKYAKEKKDWGRGQGRINKEAKRGDEKAGQYGHVSWV